MQKLFSLKGIQCLYLTFMGINKLQKTQSTKMFVSVQKLSVFDTVSLRRGISFIHFQNFVLRHSCRFVTTSLETNLYLEHVLNNLQLVTKKLCL
jgi:hypothetical protein